MKSTIKIVIFLVSVLVFFVWVGLRDDRFSENNNSPPSWKRYPPSWKRYRGMEWREKAPTGAAYKYMWWKVFPDGRLKHSIDNNNWDAVIEKTKWNSFSNHEKHDRLKEHLNLFQPEIKSGRVVRLK